MAEKYRYLYTKTMIKYFFHKVFVKPMTVKGSHVIASNRRRFIANMLLKINIQWCIFKSVNPYCAKTLKLLLKIQD